MPTMKTQPDWLSVKFATLAAGVDRKANVLRDYVLAQEGPFKSEGRGEFDKESLAAIVKLGNGKAKGLKSRFTHPDMSSDGLGKFLGRSRDLKMGTAIDARTGKKVAAVRGDLHFDRTALEEPPQGGKPLGLYVMDLAESDPEALSSSLVLMADEEFRQEKDGTLTKDDDGETLPPIWRPTVVHATDIVDTGDAVDGLLSSQLSVDGMPLSELWKGAEWLDRVFAGQPREVVEARLRGYVSRYLSRCFDDTEATPNIDARRLQMDEIRLTVAKLLQ